MVDSRAKGRTAEMKARDMLRKLTNYTWERIPASGALSEVHGLKGDLYIPKKDNYWCVEVKHYKDDHLTSKLLTSKTPQLVTWWEQTKRQAEQVEKEPLLIFKHDRSKWFIAFMEESFEGSLNYPIDLYINFYSKHGDLIICLLEDFCNKLNPTDWIK